MGLIHNCTAPVNNVAHLSTGLLFFVTCLASVSFAGENKSFYDFAMKSISGETVKLSQYKGKVILIVNVASHCGHTPQYKDLEALFQKYKGKGLVVLGFPANNFGKQEPGNDDEIKTFCETNYGVTFDLFSKISVNGADQHPLYKFITENEIVGGEIKWNFQKYIVNKKGLLTHKFLSSVKPSSEEVVTAIEEALKQ
jgi:glutathione peroxidase